MIPTSFHRTDALPLTANGKVDRSRLMALAGEFERADGEVASPNTAAERRLAEAWATVLGIPVDRIGRRDDFFDRGGTSLAALKLVVELDRAVTLREVTEHPVLADLAALAGDGAERRSELRAVAEPAGLDAASRGKPPIVRLDRPADVSGWAAENRDDLREIVAEHGSVLVRGLGLRDAGEVGAVFQQLAGRLMTETEAFASRRAYSDGVYSSSTWPATQPMCMHHELSFALEFPGMLLFACLNAPGEGGATAVAGSPAVLEELPADLVERFEREGWLLTRNYNDEIGASIGEAFGTDDRDAVERYCRANAINVEWQPDGGLRTRQRRSAVVRHPVNGRRCWFNQVAFLSEWTMDPEVREYLLDLYGEDGLPFSTSFGNGEEIGQDVVQLVNSVYDAHTMREPWQTGDLMLVDNLGAAHSREPFEGPREVLVGLADPVRAADCAPTIEVAAA
jgi:alpha-ketoglutarate-dependent taurine dioxygenase